MSCSAKSAPQKHTGAHTHTVRITTSRGTAAAGEWAGRRGGALPASRTQRRRRAAGERRGRGGFAWPTRTRSAPTTCWPSSAALYLLSFDPGQSITQHNASSTFTSATWDQQQQSVRTYFLASAIGHILRQLLTARVMMIKAHYGGFNGWHMIFLTLVRVVAFSGFTTRCQSTVPRHCNGQWSTGG